jgi:penicillin-binding protein 1C
LRNKNPRCADEASGRKSGVSRNCKAEGQCQKPSEKRADAGKTIRICRFKNRAVIFAITLFAVIFCALAALRFFPKRPVLSGFSFSTAVFDRNGTLLRLTASKDGQYRLFVPLSQMPQSLKTGTLLYEDRFFYMHPGFNPVALAKGFWISVVKKRRAVGASTISMQTARIIYGINSSNVSGKIRQTAAALLLEARYSKNDILEAYLNIAPYGYNIEGAGAAALIYFSVKPKDLTLFEAFSLCVIPQNPNFRKIFDVRIKDKTEKMRKLIFGKWVKKYPRDLDKESYFNMPMQIRKPDSLPFFAPHFTDRVLSSFASSSALSSGASSERYGRAINTTLNLGLQKTLEARIKNYIDRKSFSGISNASAILVNYKTMEVLAYIGSADFFDDSIEGQVNGLSAYRSPGSVMKPFIYALALEKGIIHPLTLLKDTPKRYGIFAPENSDKDFFGPVFAKNALVQSRNIPAIDLLIKITPDSFIDLLKKAGVENLKSAGYYGSSLAIGGFEISAEKIAQMYAMLANGGIMQDLKFTKDAQNNGARVLSSEAAFLALDMLKDNAIPEGGAPAARGSANKAPFQVYWKTGTSYAYRDAWTAGVFGDYVLVVWVGKFNNDGQETYLARRAAAPLFFELIKSIYSEDKNAAYSGLDASNLNLREVEVCAISGDLPNAYCRKTLKTHFIPLKSPITVCDVHRPVFIDKKTGLRRPYYDPEKTNVSVYEFWSSEILSVFEAAGIAHKKPPKFLPDLEINEISHYGKAPQIILPVQNITYVFRAQNFENESMAFQADADADAKALFWFLDNKYVGQSKPGTILSVKPPSGVFSVKAVDDLGRSSEIPLKVEIIGE